jgi:hypothetical protein
MTIKEVSYRKVIWLKKGRLYKFTFSRLIRNVNSRKEVLEPSQVDSRQIQSINISLEFLIDTIIRVANAN